MTRMLCRLAAGLLCLGAITAQGQSPQHNAGDETAAPRFQGANMHLCPEGKWALGEDDWGKIVRVNMLQITAGDWAKVPGVKKAWPMKGFEGVEGMAFHPIISEVKDVDFDGKPDIFRCRSEHPGARIERPPLRRRFGGLGKRAHAMPGGHEGVRRQVDLDGNGRADVIMPFGEWHWGSDSILFLMEGLFYPLFGGAAASAGGELKYDFGPRGSRAADGYIRLGIEQPPNIQYARDILNRAGRDGVELKVAANLGHREAFRVVTDGDRQRVEAASPAGLIYGAQAVVRREATPGAVEKPDFDVRGTTLWLGGAVQGRRIVPYHSGFNSETLPWFFDRPFMRRYLDRLGSARFNTLFLWASHPFPYLLDLPKYPGATKLQSEQLRRNQEQFRWLVSECGRRNISVLLHFYNIHLPDGLREQFGGHASWGASAVKNPSPEIAEYYRYVLGRYFEEFDNVGLYICPGETLATSRQLEWFRDVIFEAARASGKNPLLIIRDWTLNMNFREQIPSLYENCYSELKHNDETFTSPVPDRRHKQWRGLLKGHVVNLHGPPMDLQPMRWASPVLIHETVTNWRKMGYVRGAEIYALSCFDWPYTQDKLTPDQFGYREQVKGPKLLWVDRSGIYLDVFGRYLWKTTRAQKDERDHWEGYLTEKFRSSEAGKHLYRWYVVTGPISPGLQNLTATRFGNFWATVMLQNQAVDQILNARKRIDDVPITLTREAGRTHQVYYSQPVDEYFFQRYKERFGLPELAERISMPVAQYAEALSAGRQVTGAMTPDKVCDLLCELADEALESARAARAAATDGDAKAELDRFVSDSQMYVLATRALRHKVGAAILKARMLRAGDADLGSEFLRHMQQSVEVYEDLAQLTDRTYRNANDLMGRHWKREGLTEFHNDLATQRAWLARFAQQRLVLPLGSIHIEAEDMEGPWRKGSDRYGDFLGQGYAASWYAAKESKPLPMKSRVQIPAERKYAVWVRALIGGAHQDRALAVEIAGQRQPSTHAGQGPESGAFAWRKAGVVKLSSGVVDVSLHPVGKGHPTADAILLVPDREWKPCDARIRPSPKLPRSK